MDGYTQYDITADSFEEFVAFLFDHEVTPWPDNPNSQPGPWYWSAEVSFDAIRVAGYYIRLFTDPKFLLTHYSSAQLEQGFWAIQSGNIECAVTASIWDKEVPLEIRESCIRSMFDLFEKLFAIDPLATSSNMWWDSLAYDWHCGIRSRGNGGEDERIQDVIFETLENILGLSSLECQAAALHGLGHLHHPATQLLIERYLQRNPEMDTALRNYALTAARFEVL